MAWHSGMVDRSHSADPPKRTALDELQLGGDLRPSDPWRIVDHHSSSMAEEALCDATGCTAVPDGAIGGAVDGQCGGANVKQEPARERVSIAPHLCPGSDPPLVRRLKELVLTGPRFDAAEADVARELGLSGRTLRRRLRELGTTYAWTLTEIRFAFAKRCLADPRLTIGEVADRAGYTEVSNFRCAFKRWANCSPQTFRNSLGLPFDD
ncbi:helix-turn-helix domain-containing protein [Sphingomonas aquatilis]